MIDLYQYKVQWCPFCDQGWVEIAKEKSSNKLFLLCEECESEWDDPQYILKENRTRDKYGLIEVPLWEEIVENGWDIFIINDLNMHDAKILDIFELSEEETIKRYKIWGINNRTPPPLNFVTFEVNDILLKGLGTNHRDWTNSQISTKTKVTISFKSTCEAKICNLDFKGLLQKEDNIYLAIGDVLEIDDRSFFLDCGSIIIKAVRISLTNINLGDRIRIESIELYLSNVELTK